jgi:hypothetical protein
MNMCNRFNWGHSYQNVVAVENEVVPNRGKKISKNLNVLELCVKYSCLDAVFGPPLALYPLFQWYPQSKKILLNSK